MSYKTIVFIYLLVTLIFSILNDNHYASSDIIFALTNASSNIKVDSSSNSSFHSNTLWLTNLGNQMHAILVVYYFVSIVVLFRINFNHLKLITCKDIFCCFCCCFDRNKSDSSKEAPNSVTNSMTLREAVNSWENNSNVAAFPVYYKVK
jgi:hypothetical protein